MGVLSLLLLLAMAGLLGAAALAALRGPSPARQPALALVAGLVALHALLLAFDLAGIPWRRGPLAAGWTAATAAALAVAAARGGPAGAREVGAPPGAWGWRPPQWGEAVAGLAVLAYAAAAWTRRVTIPDFVYHWGSKAKRYLLAGGVDYGFLGDPLRLTDHPDYPSLVPGLYAAVGIVRGAFHERAALLASVAFLLLALAGVREAARRAEEAGLPRWAGQAALAAAALTLAGFGVGYRMAGAADWPLVAALCVALPALVAVRPADGDDALRLGLAAALAAGAKIEGVPLAALLIAAGVARLAPRWRGESRFVAWRPVGGDLARLAVPPLALVAPWAVQNLRHGLFAAENSGPLLAERVPVAAAAAAEALSTPEWLGLPWLLLLLPALVVRRTTRAAAAVLLLQGAFYAWVYLTSPVDTRFFVLSSMPRLLFHLVPPLVVLLALAALTPRSGMPRCRTGRTGSPAR